MGFVEFCFAGLFYVVDWLSEFVFLLLVEICYKVLWLLIIIITIIIYCN